MGAVVAAVAITGAGVAAWSQNGGKPPQAAASVSLITARRSPGTADGTASAYARAHYPGPGKLRVLATESDTERGTAVYDVRILAPNGVIYVIHVRRGNDTVMWASKAENQATGRASQLPRPKGSAGSADAPDHGPGSPASSPDSQDQPDTPAGHGSDR